MKIEEIKPLKKGLCSLRADGEEFILNCETVAAAGLCKDMEVGRETLLNLKEKSELDRAKSRALYYLSRSDCSRKTLYDKLCRSFSEKASSEAVDRMEELGFIDDKRYAARLAEYLSRDNVSDREILRKLFVKGIPRDLAAEAVEALSSSPEAQIEALIEKKYKRKLLEERGEEKVFAALVRKGFSFSDVKSVLRKYSENEEFCEE